MLQVARPTASPDDILLTFEGINDSILLLNQARPGDGVETLHFADGTIWSAGEIRQAALDQTASAGSDERLGYDGQDLFHFNLGDGQDILQDIGQDGALDRLVFGTGIAAADLAISRLSAPDGAWLLQLPVATDSVTLAGPSAEGMGGLEEIVFADGTVWTEADLRVEYLARAATDGDDTIKGFESADNLTGGLGEDRLEGFRGDDSLSGGEGNDWLFGNEGDDLLQGGGGDDHLEGGYGNDTFDGGEGSDTAVFGYSLSLWTVDLALGTASTEASEESLVSIENVIGGLGNDTLLGDGLDNAFSGGAGDDQLDGRGGNDLLEGGEGSDQLSGGDGDDTLRDDSGANQLFGGLGNDSLTVLGGSGTIDGGEGFDTLDLTEAHEAVSLDLGTNAAVLFGGAFDLFDIEAVVGGAWNDVIVGDAADNLFEGGLGADDLDGGTGEDALLGGEGADQLSGGSGPTASSAA